MNIMALGGDIGVKPSQVLRLMQSHPQEVDLFISDGSMYIPKKALKFIMSKIKKKR